MKQLKKEDLDRFIGKDMYVVVTEDRKIFRISNQFQYFAGFEQDAVQDCIYDIRALLPGLGEHLQMMKYRISCLSSFTDLCTKEFYPFIRIAGYGDLPLQEVISCRSEIIDLLSDYLYKNIMEGLPVFFLAGAKRTYIHETIDDNEMALSFYTSVRKAKQALDLEPQVYSVYARQLDKLNPYGFYSINSKLIYGIEILNGLEEARKKIRNKQKEKEGKNE